MMVREWDGVGGGIQVSVHGSCLSFFSSDVVSLSVERCFLLVVDCMYI